MPSIQNRLENILDEFGREIDQERESVSVTSTSCIDDGVPSTSGVYWIETTMPVCDMRRAIQDITGRSKPVRRNPPDGINLISQIGNSLYVVYVGTDGNMKRRLKQHLFSEGSDSTGKLGCVINEVPFSNYEWRVGSREINRYDVRCAVEAWWRLRVGWPIFCIR